MLRSAWSGANSERCRCVGDVIAACMVESFDTNYAAAIRRAYRRLSLVHHPDKNPQDRDGASKRFQRLAAAYEILSDEDNRASYDTYLENPDAFLAKFQYFRWVAAKKTDARVVVVSFILLVSVFQFWSQHSKHKFAVDHFRSSRKVVMEATKLAEDRLREEMGALLSRADKASRKQVEKRRKELRQECIEELAQQLQVSGAYRPARCASLPSTAAHDLPHRHPRQSPRRPGRAARPASMVARQSCCMASALVLEVSGQAATVWSGGALVLDEAGPGAL